MPPRTKSIVECKINSVQAELRLSRQMHNRKLELVVNYKAPGPLKYDPVWLGTLEPSQRLARVLQKLPYFDENEMSHEFKAGLYAGELHSFC